MEEQQPKPNTERNIYLTITAIIQGALLTGLVWFCIRGNWENVFLTTSVVVLTLMPLFFKRRFDVNIPPEFQCVSAVFVFLSLFLGSAADFYYTYWWWDVVLHVSSGFLLGIIGFLSLFLLNQTDQMPQGLKPRFIFLFAIMTAVFLGVIWEIFEFTVDQIWPTINMQSNETGVVDTMQDLIIDLLGAIIVAAMGWVYLRTGRYSFIADGVRNFVIENPGLFNRKRRKKRGKKSRIGEL